jgi:creatinine amidohydrolase
MTWPEVREATPHVDAVLIPVGVTEQHGRHMVMDTDTNHSVYFCERAAAEVQARGGYVLVAPPLCYGASWYHMKFPGTIAIRQRTFMDVIKDICVSLNEHGLRNLIIFNSHGGNTNALRTALDEMMEECHLRVLLAQYFMLVQKAMKDLGIESPFIHSEEVETSIAMAQGNRVVMAEATRACFSRKEVHAQKGIPTSRHISYDLITPGSGVFTPMDWLHEVSETGVVGDASKAKMETGKVLNDHCTNVLVELILDLAGKP